MTTPNLTTQGALPQTAIVMDSAVDQPHGDNWSRWYTCGATIDEWIITVNGNDVLVQFAPLGREQNVTPAIKRRVGESGRDRQRQKGIGMMRVKSLTPGANGTFDLEMYGG